MSDNRLQFMNRDDQLVSAIMLVVFLIGTGVFFWQRSVINDRVIDFEDMPSRHFQYLVDINSAGWPELSNLPGIGEKLAKQIVDYRDQNGPFNSTDELTSVSGIGKGKLRTLEPHIYIKVEDD